jgi:hypothetical protein
MIAIKANLIAFAVAALLAWSCNQKKSSSDTRSSSRPSSDAENLPATLDSEERTVSSNKSETVTVGQTSIKFEEGTVASDYRVRLSRLESAPVGSKDDSLFIGSPESDVVSIEMYDAATDRILSQEDLALPYVFQQEFTTSSPSAELGLMVVKDAGTSSETRTLLPNAELRITESSDAAGLRLLSARKITVSVSLKLTQAVVWLVSYDQKTLDKLATAKSDGAAVTSLSKLAAKPGDEVSLSGSNIHSRLKVEIEGKSVAVVASNTSSGKFLMPDVRAGLVTVAVKEGSSTVKSLGLVSDSAGDGIPVWLGTATEICSDKQFRNASGEVVQGTRNCAVLADCSADGQENCRSNGAYRAADLTGAANKIVSGQTLAGVPGAASGGSGASASDAWHIRAGTTVAGVTGKLKVNCRNGVNLSEYNYDGSLSGIPATSVAHNTTPSRDPWDTIDDYNRNDAILSLFPNANLPGSWSTDNFCGGIEATANDSNVWKDVSVDGVDPDSVGCSNSSDACIFKDKISGLEWSELISSSRNWPDALNDCNSSNLGGHSDWRLPTQKELMDAYSHGIRSAGTTNWLTSAEMNNYFWSASSVSDDTNDAWVVYLSNGYSGGNVKTSTTHDLVCVR